MSEVHKLIGDILSTGLSPEQIYHDIANGPGAESLVAAKDMVDQQTSLHEEIMQLIEEQHADIASGFQGEAGENALNAATPVRSVAEQAALQLGTAGQLLTQQEEMFHQTKNTVVPMPPKPMAEADFISPLYPMLDDHAAQNARYDEAARINKDAYESYNASSTAVGDGLPTDYGGLVTATDNMQLQLKHPMAPPMDGDSGNYPAPPPGSSGSVPGGQPSGPTQPVAGSVSPGGPPGGESPQVPAADGGYVPPESDGTRPESDGTQPEFDDSTQSAGYTPGALPGQSSSTYAPGSTGYGSPYASPGGPNSGTTGGYGGIGGGAGGTGGGYAPGRPPAGSPGAPGKGAEPLGQGKGTGARPMRPGSGAAPPASGGTTSSTTSSTGRGMPMGAGGGGRKGEDEEHTRKTPYQEDDPESIFRGELPGSTPPVIGEKQPKKKGE